MLSLLFTEVVRMKPRQGSAQRLRECWTEFSGLILAPCLGNFLLGKPREDGTPFFSSPFRAKRKVSCAPMAWYAPLGVGGDLAGGYLHPPPNRKRLLFLIQVDFGLDCLPTAKISVLPPAGAHGRSAGRWALEIPLPLPHLYFSMKLD